MLEGAGLDPAALQRVQALPGVAAATRISPLSIAVKDPDLRSAGAAAVSDGQLGRLLDLDVVSGSLTELGSGHIAISTILVGMFAWQAVFLTVCGIAAGAAVCAGALTAVNRAATGRATPYFPPGSAALIVSSVAILTTVPSVGAFRTLRRR